MLVYAGGLVGMASDNSWELPFIFNRPHYAFLVPASLSNIIALCVLKNFVLS